MYVTNNKTMEISFGHYPGYLAKSFFIDFCKKNGIIINDEYLNFLLKNHIINPKIILEDKDGIVYSLQKAHIIGVITAIKNCDIKLHNFDKLSEKYLSDVRYLFNHLDKMVNVSMEIDKLINGFFVFKYKKLEEFEKETKTIEERNEKWDDYTRNSEDFERLGFREYLEDGCKNLMKEFDIDNNYIDILRYRIGKLTFFGRNPLDLKSIRRYLKSIEEDDLIKSEYLNELIYKINLFSLYSGGSAKTIKDVLFSVDKDRKERICTECGKSFIYSRETELTCSRICSNNRKNRLKRAK